jgi:serine/threonine protein kinase/tetratricopeptide (TPR) repeat protein
MQPDQVQRLRAALGPSYRIERELGSGGMATVFLAEDLKHRRPVAVKVLRPDLAAAIGPERFLREIAVAATLNHPHILSLHDSGDAGGFLFYVMPFITGESLRQVLEREHQLPVEQAIGIARQVAAALAYAHGQGVIHRDIKPENILLHEGEAMVADFGIALAATGTSGERLTETGMLVGTPEYMSPEQGMGERPVDARSDVYSLGCVLYEMLAGEPPHTGPTAQAVIAKRMTDPVPGVRRLREGVTTAVDHTISKALARAPADRFSSAAAFADALTHSDAAPPHAGSVAVLPFLNLSANPDNEYFADGITEDVIAQLSKIRALKVISRTSVMPFKRRDKSLRDIAAQLEVATLLEGSVRRAGDRVRIVAQLIDAATDQHLWAETYDRQLTDIFAIQTDVAVQIATALRAELSHEERARIHAPPTSDLGAYQLFLQGRAWYRRYTEEGINKGIEYFHRAISADPGYAMAYTAVAVAYGELISTGQGGRSVRPDEAHERARQAVEKALTLDQRLGEAHGVLALLKFIWDYDWVGAEQEFKLALELSPGGADIYDHYGWLCGALGRYDESYALVKRAQELDPLTHRADVASALLRAGRYPEALEQALRSVEFDPQYARGRATLAWAYIKNDRLDEGIAELEQSVALAPEDTMLLGQLGEAYAVAGRSAEARDMQRRLEELSRQRYVSPYHFAYVPAGLGDAETTIDWLEKASQERAGGIYGIKGSFLFADLRAHPRFQALLKRMNLSP